MAGWHHWLDGQVEQAPGVGEEQGRLACRSPWDCKELDTTEQVNWTECLNSSEIYGKAPKRDHFHYSSAWAGLVPSLWWTQQLWHAFRYRDGKTTWEKPSHILVEFQFSKYFSLKYHSINKVTPSIAIKEKRSSSWWTALFFFPFGLQNLKSVQHTMRQMQAIHRTV